MSHCTGEAVGPQRQLENELQTATFGRSQYITKWSMHAFAEVFYGLPFFLVVFILFYNVGAENWSDNVT